jgi:hypothetical protein
MHDNTPTAVPSHQINITYSTRQAAQNSIANITAIEAFTNTTPTENANAVVDKLTGNMLELQQIILGPDGVEWIWSTVNEFGRLTNSVQPHIPTGSKIMRYIYHHELPKGGKATYSRFLVSEHPNKVESKRVHLTVGGNKIDHPCQVSTPTAGINSDKLLFNSVV